MKPSNKDKYPIAQSPLWRIGTKRRLAEILKSDLVTIRQLITAGNASYKNLMAVGKRGKKRPVQDPVPALKLIQRYINTLLQRIQYPEYMMAGVKGLSYEKNALQHITGSKRRICTIDIQKFYPNCQRGAVVRSFERWFELPFDVASCLADLVCLNGHLPTGGPTSLLISYWSNKDIFDAIKTAADKEGLKMTVYVDDMAFSGENAGLCFLHDHVLPILSKAGLRGHKMRVFSKSKFAEITGLILKDSKVELPFQRFKDIDDDMAELRLTRQPAARLKILNRVISKLYSVATYHPSTKAMALHLQKKRKELLARSPHLKARQRLGKVGLALAREERNRRHKQFMSERSQSET